MGSLNTYNETTNKWESLASNEAAGISLNSGYLKSTNVNDGLVELYKYVALLKQNIIWLYNNGMGKNSAFTYSLPLILSAFADSSASDFIIDEGDNIKGLNITNKVEGDELTAEEFTAVVNVINNNLNHFIRKSPITYTDDLGVEHTVDISTIAELITYLQENGVTIPTNNHTPKITFGETSYVFAIGATISLPITITDIDGGYFKLKFTLTNLSTSTYEQITISTDSALSNEPLHIGENTLTINSSLISTTSSGTYTISNIVLYDNLYKTYTIASPIKIIVGSLKFTTVSYEPCIVAGTNGSVTFRFTSVLSSLKLFVQYDYMSLSTYSVTSVEAEEIDLDLNADGTFNTATVYSKTWPFKTSNNALFTIKYRLVSSELKSGSSSDYLLDTGWKSLQIVALDANSLYCHVTTTSLEVESNESVPISYTFYNSGGLTLDDNYALAIDNSDGTDSTLTLTHNSGVFNTLIDTETSESINLTFTPSYTGTNAGGLALSVVPSKLTFTVKSSASTVSTSNLTLWLDAKGRNSSEDPATVMLWPNKRAASIIGTITNFTAGLTQGWEATSITNECVGNTLVLNNGAYATVDYVDPVAQGAHYYPLKNLDTTGCSIEFCVHSDSYTLDNNTTLFSVGNINALGQKQGIYLTPTELNIYIGNTTITVVNSTNEYSYRYNGVVDSNEMEYLHYAVVFANINSESIRESGLVLVYINGIICKAVEFPNVSSGINGKLILNGYQKYDGTIDSTGEMKIRFLRFYDAILTSETVLENYLASIYSNTEKSFKAISNIDWLNQDKTEVPTVTKFYASGPSYNISGLLSDVSSAQTLEWTAVEGNEELLGTSFSFIPNITPASGYENITFTLRPALTGWQGSSSLTYPIKNYDMTLLQKVGIGEPSDVLKWRMTDEFDFLYKYQLKANYIDSGNANNISVAKMFNQLWASTWGSTAMGYIQKVDNNNLTFYTNPTFSVIDDNGTTINTSRYPMYSKYKALNGFPFILYRDLGADASLSEKFAGIYMMNTKQDEDLYGFPDILDSAGAWGRNLAYKHDNLGPTSYSELTSYISFGDARAIYDYTTNGKYKTLKRGKTVKNIMSTTLGVTTNYEATIFEMLGFDLLMAMEQFIPSNFGYGLRNGLDYTQWKYNNISTKTDAEIISMLSPYNGLGSRTSETSAYTKENLWTYKWEFSEEKDSSSNYKYMNVKTGTSIIYPNRSASSSFSQYSEAIANISDFKLTCTTDNNDYLQWSEKAALAYHQNADFINAMLWAATSSDEDFADPEKFNRYFRLDCTIDYFITTNVLELLDSLGRNMCFTAWDPTTSYVASGITKYRSKDKLIFYPVAYDLDTSYGTNVSGQQISFYRPFPHAYGSHKGLENGAVACYNITINTSPYITSSSVISTGLGSVASGSIVNDSTTYTDITSTVTYRYFFYQDENHILIDGLSYNTSWPTTIPAGVNNVRICAVSNSGNIVASQRFLIDNTAICLISNNKLSYSTSVDACVEYIQFLINNDHKIPTAQVQKVTIKGMSVSSIQMSSTYYNEDGTTYDTYVGLSSTPVSIDDSYPLKFSYVDNVITITATAWGEFDYYCFGDTLKIKVNNDVVFEIPMVLSLATEDTYTCTANNFLRRVGKLYSNAIKARYTELRAGYSVGTTSYSVLTEENIVKKYASEITNRVGEFYYNEDAFFKYLGTLTDSTSEKASKRSFMYNARGNKFLFVKDFINKRLGYVDAFMDYIDTSDVASYIKLGHTHTGTMSLTFTANQATSLTVKWTQTGPTTRVTIPSGDTPVTVSYTYGSSSSTNQMWISGIRYITKIEGLSDKHIQEIILQNPDSLHNLDLSGSSNTFSSGFEISAGTELTYLNLENTINVDGDTLGASEFSSLTKLETLLLSNSGFKLSDFSLYPKLKTLKVDGTAITELNISSTVNLTNLTLSISNIVTLNLANSAWTGAGYDNTTYYSNILDDGSKWTALKNLYAEGATKIVKIGSIHGFPILEALTIHNCALLEDCHNIFDYLKNTTGAKTLLTASTSSNNKFLGSCPKLSVIIGLFQNTDIETIPSYFCTTLGTGYLAGTNNLTDASYCFEGCFTNTTAYNITNAALFPAATTCTPNCTGIFQGANITGTVRNDFLPIGLTSISKAFKNTNITGFYLSGNGTFVNNTYLTDISEAFSGCQYIVTIPTTLLSGCTNVVNFTLAFNSCGGITSAVPEWWNTYTGVSVIPGLCFKGCFQAANHLPVGEVEGIPEAWGGPREIIVTITSDSSEEITQDGTSNILSIIGDYKLTYVGSAIVENVRVLSYYLYGYTDATVQFEFLSANNELSGGDYTTSGTSTYFNTILEGTTSLALEVSFKPTVALTVTDNDYSTLMANANVYYRKTTDTEFILAGVTDANGVIDVKVQSNTSYVFKTTKTGYQDYTTEAVLVGLSDTTVNVYMKKYYSVQFTFKNDWYINLPTANITISNPTLIGSDITLTTDSAGVVRTSLLVSGSGYSITINNCAELGIQDGTTFSLTVTPSTLTANVVYYATTTNPISNLVSIVPYTAYDSSIWFTIRGYDTDTSCTLTFTYGTGNWTTPPKIYWTGSGSVVTDMSSGTTVYTKTYGSTKDVKSIKITNPALISSITVTGCDLIAFWSKGTSSIDFSNSYFNGNTNLLAISSLALSHTRMNYSGYFSGCTSLKFLINQTVIDTTITNTQNSLFKDTMSATDMSYIFYNCLNIKVFDVSMFAGCSSVTNLSYAFVGSGITSFVTGLFDPLVALSNISYMCSGLQLTSLQSGIFTYNTNIANASHAFENILSISSVPSDLLSTSTVLSDIGFIFYLSAVNANDLLTSVDANWLLTKTTITNCQQAFYNRSKLVGSVPEWWESWYFYVTSYSNCFKNININVTNYSKIPESWGGASGTVWYAPYYTPTNGFKLSILLNGTLLDNTTYTVTTPGVAGDATEKSFIAVTGQDYNYTYVGQLRCSMYPIVIKSSGITYCTSRCTIIYGVDSYTFEVGPVTNTGSLNTSLYISDSNITTSIPVSGGDYMNSKLIVNNGSNYYLNELGDRSWVMAKRCMVKAVSGGIAVAHINDSGKYVGDTSITPVFNCNDGQWMVELPEYWFKVDSNSEKTNHYPIIKSSYFEGATLSPKMYLGVCKSFLYSTALSGVDTTRQLNTLWSIAATGVLTNTLNATTGTNRLNFISAARTFSPLFGIADYEIYNKVNQLFYVKYGTKDIQGLKFSDANSNLISLFGNNSSISTGSEVIGGTISLYNNDGKTADQNSFMGIENLYTGFDEMIDGIHIYNGNMYIYKNSTSVLQSTDMTSSAISYRTIQNYNSVEGLIEKEIIDTNFDTLPKEADSSQTNYSTYFADSCYIPNSTITGSDTFYARKPGYNSDESSGINSIKFSLNNVSNTVYTARLMFRPEYTIDGTTRAVTYTGVTEYDTSSLLTGFRNLNASYKENVLAAILSFSCRSSDPNQLQVGGYYVTPAVSLVSGILTSTGVEEKCPNSLYSVNYVLQGATSQPICTTTKQSFGIATVIGSYGANAWWNNSNENNLPSVATDCLSFSELAIRSGLIMLNDNTKVYTDTTIPTESSHDGFFIVKLEIPNGVYTFKTLSRINNNVGTNQNYPDFINVSVCTNLTSTRTNAQTYLHTDDLKTKANKQLTFSNVTVNAGIVYVVLWAQRTATYKDTWLNVYPHLANVEIYSNDAAYTPVKLKSEY